MEQSTGKVYLLLGSNLGDRSGVLQLAIDRIGERVGKVVRVSGIYETAPWGVVDQPSFLNQVIAVETLYAPEEVLRLVLDIEHELGRVRYERWGARVIDIDILFYNDLMHMRQTHSQVFNSLLIMTHFRWCKLTFSIP